MLSSSPSSSNDSSHVSRKKYDVFLSFRGKDTRTNFTDHLYSALKGKGIITFKDDRGVEAGEAIAPELFKAIQESWCSVIVFSKTYASSGWCLDELAEIVKQKNEGRHKIFPIFYDVDPSDLRYQKGRVAEAFAKHEERYKENKDKTRTWRSALNQVANLNGWHLNDRHESEFIGDIVKKLLAKLCQVYSSVPDDLIGIYSRLEGLHSKIDIGEDDIRIIGICGMGGIGKTTLARVVYAQMSPHFEGKSFVSDIREVSAKSGLASVQKQILSEIFPAECFNFSDVHVGSYMISRMLSCKKVLIIIDDVDNFQHLKWLVGRRDWFGFGSRIIVTTRDEHLLLSHGVDDVYKPTALDADEALRLFSLKAFNSNTPKNGFIELSKCVVKYADGLPLALEVLGSFFCGKDEAQWKNAIERLKRESKKEIHERLRISFDGLEETEKNIFLDIACFFKGQKKDLVMEVLDGCEFFPDIGIDVLLKKSLIKVYEDEFLGMIFGMHDLLQQMGRKIVEQKSLEEPGKRCRLWEERDVYHVLTNNTATEAIEGMDIDIKCSEQCMVFTSNFDALLKMKKLRLLRVFSLPNSHNLKYLPNELRLLHWNHYPLRCLPSSFRPYNLVALLLPYSRIEQLWKGNVCLKRLKLVNLKGSENLLKTPDFTMAPNLERLILKGCIKIVDVHPSVGLLRRLKVLNLKNCKSLKSLPTKIRTTSLEKLILSGCSNLKRLPEEIDGEMECLVELDLSETAITKPEPYIFEFKNLKHLSFRGCKGLPSKLLSNLLSLFKLMQGGSITKSEALTLPSFSCLTSLTDLDISYCNLGEGAIPSDICCLSSLRKLKLSGNNFISLPANLDRLSNLKVLGLEDCMQLKSLPELLTCTVIYDSGNDTPTGLFANAKGPDSIADAGMWLKNCDRLAEDKNILTTLLKKHLKACRSEHMSIVVPGRDIPEWFSHQDDGYSITIPIIPSDILKDSQWIGVAFCCVFVTDDDYLSGRIIIHGRKSRAILCGRIDPGPITKNHLWLCYTPREMLYSFFSEDQKLGDDETNFEESDDQELEVVIKPRCISLVKKCGVRIVYERDLEEMEINIKGHSQLQICNIPKNNDESKTEKGALVKANRRDIILCPSFVPGMVPRAVKFRDALNYLSGIDKQVLNYHMMQNSKNH